MASASDICSRIVRWIPCIFIIAIVFWSYYAYVVELCIYTVESTAQQVLYLIFYHFFFGMFVWSYWQIIFSDVMTPSAGYYVPTEYYAKVFETDDPEERQATLKQIVARNNLTVVTRDIAGGIRYCGITKAIKPDRCHYCSVVKKCVLKMDHYCPWVNNCVGYSNYKFFVLFLMYGFLYCLYVSCTDLEYFIGFWQNLMAGSAKFHILFLFFASIMFAISLVGLLGYHLYLVCKNQTTLESFRSPIFSYGSDSAGFSIGTLRNFEQVFGERKLLWFVPIFTAMGDGMSYPTRLISRESDFNLVDGSDENV